MPTLARPGFAPRPHWILPLNISTRIEFLEVIGRGTALIAGADGEKAVVPKERSDSGFGRVGIPDFSGVRSDQ